MKRIFKTLSQKWPEYILEILVLIIGIYGAFALDEWKEKTKEKAQEQTLLYELQREFGATRVNIQKTLVNQQKVLDHMAGLMELYYSNGKGFDATSDSLGVLIDQGALSYWRIEPVVGAYESILGAGSLDLLKDKDLRRYMANFYSEVTQGFEDHDLSIQLIQSINSRIKPFWTPDWLLKRIEVDMSVNNRDLTALRKANFSDLLNDDILFSIINTRASLEKNRIEWQMSILIQVEMILDQIDKNTN